MARLTDTVDLSLGGALEAFGYFGIPNPLDWLDEVDGDPDEIAAATRTISTAMQQVGEVSDILTGGLGDIDWSGTASASFSAVLDAFVEGLRATGDLLLWIVENVLQVIDWILDLFRWVCNLLILLATIILAIFVAVMAAIAIAAASVVGSPSIPGIIAAGAQAAWAAVSGTAGTILGAIAIFGAMFALAARLLDALVEGLIDLIHGWREDLGDRLPELPDWDPQQPPVFPT